MTACACAASSASCVHVWLFLPVFSQKGEALVFAGGGSIATSWPPVWSKVNIWREATVQAGTWGGALLVPPSPLSHRRPPPLPPCTAVGQTPPEARRGQICRCCCHDETASPPGKFLLPSSRSGCVLASLKRPRRITGADQPLQVYFIPTRTNTKKYFIRPSRFVFAMQGYGFHFRGLGVPARFSYSESRCCFAWHEK